MDRVTDPSVIRPSSGGSSGAEASPKNPKNDHGADVAGPAIILVVRMYRPTAVRPGERPALKGRAAGARYRLPFFFVAFFLPFFLVFFAI